MAEERRDAVRPDFFIHPSKDEFVYDKNLGYGKFKLDNLALNITNIGIGPAKIVKCEWNFDYEKCFNIIKPFNKNDKFYYSEKNKIAFNESSVTYFEDDFHARLFPLINAGKEESIRFPFTYIRMLGIMKHLVEEGKLQEIDIPKIELCIGYLNIFNETIPPKSFLIHPIMNISTSHGSDGKIEGYQGVINIVPNEIVKEK